MSKDRKLICGKQTFPYILIFKNQNFDIYKRTYEISHSFLKQNNQTTSNLRTLHYLECYWNLPTASKVESHSCPSEFHYHLRFVTETNGGLRWELGNRQSADTWKEVYLRSNVFIFTSGNEGCLLWFLGFQDTSTPAPTNEWLSMSLVTKDFALHSMSHNFKLYSSD